MTISDKVLGGIPSSSIAAMKADFVTTVQDRTEDDGCHDDRADGSLAGTHSHHVGS